MKRFPWFTLFAGEWGLPAHGTGRKRGRSFDGNRDELGRNGDAASIDGGHRSLVLSYPSQEQRKKHRSGQVYHVLNRSVGKMHLFGKGSRNGDATRIKN